MAAVARFGDAPGLSIDAAEVLDGLSDLLGGDHVPLAEAKVALVIKVDLLLEGCGDSKVAVPVGVELKELRVDFLDGAVEDDRIAPGGYFHFPFGHKQFAALEGIARLQTSCEGLNDAISQGP